MYKLCSVYIYSDVIYTTERQNDCSLSDIYDKRSNPTPQHVLLSLWLHYTTLYNIT